MYSYIPDCRHWILIIRLLKTHLEITSTASCFSKLPGASPQYFNLTILNISMLSLLQDHCFHDTPCMQHILCHTLFCFLSTFAQILHAFSVSCVQSRLKPIWGCYSLYSSIHNCNMEVFSFLSSLLLFYCILRFGVDSAIHGMLQVWWFIDLNFSFQSLKVFWKLHYLVRSKWILSDTEGPTCWDWKQRRERGNCWCNQRRRPLIQGDSLLDGIEGQGKWSSLEGGRPVEVWIKRQEGNLPKLGPQAACQQSGALCLHLGLRGHWESLGALGGDRDWKMAWRRLQRHLLWVSKTHLHQILHEGIVQTQ